MIKVSVNQIPAKLRQGKKRSAYVSIVTEAHIPSDAGLWSGGSRDLYHSLNLSNGMTAPAVSFHNSAPFSGTGRRDVTIPLQSGLCVVRTGTFCGKESAPHYYIVEGDKGVFGL